MALVEIGQGETVEQTLAGLAARRSAPSQPS